jgi:hypothetical protein
MKIAEIFLFFGYLQIFIMSTTFFVCEKSKGVKMKGMEPFLIF